VTGGKEGGKERGRGGTGERKVDKEEVGRGKLRRKRWGVAYGGGDERRKEREEVDGRTEMGRKRGRVG